MTELLGPVKKLLSYEMLLILRVFREQPSFGEVADRLDKDERTVSRMLRDLSEAFEKERGVPLLRRPVGRRGYELTEVGIAFSQAAKSAALSLEAAVTSAANAAEVLEMPVTNDLLSDLRDLSSKVGARGVTLYPSPRRSSEFPSLSQPDRAAGGHAYRYALFSAALSDDFPLQPGRIVPLENNKEVLVRRVAEFQLLAPADIIGHLEEVKLSEVRQLGITLLVPRGGAVSQYLDYVYPDGPLLEPHRYVESTDLDFGLRCLKMELIPCSGMIVHGWDPHSPEVPDGYRLTPLRSDKRQQYNATTGLFHDKSADDDLSDEARKRWSLVWQTARTLWGEE